MIEDSALTLKIDYERGDTITIKDAQKLLEQSELINKLLTPPKRGPNTFVGLRVYMWRLLELSEIPFTNTLEEAQKWIELLVNKSYIEEGFALEGKKDNLLSCHNALITTILIKMEYNVKEKIEAGINWILDYQAVERGKEPK